MLLSRFTHIIRVYVDFYDFEISNKNKWQAFGLNMKIWMEVSDHKWIEEHMNWIPFSLSSVYLWEMKIFNIFC